MFLLNTKCLLYGIIPPRMNPEKKEDQIQKGKEVWMIDDDSALLNSVIRNWKIVTQELHTDIKGFSTAGEACTELQKRVDEKKRPPDLIYIDGELGKDIELRYGYKVVVDIISLYQNTNLERPQLVAYSSDEDSNRAMQQKGANFTQLKDPRYFDQNLDFLQAFLKGEIQHK